MSHCSLKPVAVVVFNNWRWNSSDVLCSDSVVGVPFLMNCNKEIAKVETVSQIW